MLKMFPVVIIVVVVFGVACFCKVKIKGRTIYIYINVPVYAMCYIKNNNTATNNNHGIEQHMFIGANNAFLFLLICPLMKVYNSLLSPPPLLLLLLLLLLLPTSTVLLLLNKILQKIDRTSITHEHTHQYTNTNKYT